jgi:hypothetical protein
MEQAYSNSYEKQAFLFSFLIHSTLFGSYLLGIDLQRDFFANNI